MNKDTTAFPGASRTSEGMIYNGAVFQPIIDKCEGCGRIREFDGAMFCVSYAMPATKWSLGSCNFSTHVKSTAQGAGQKVNPLKASKRASKGGKK